MSCDTQHHSAQLAALTAAPLPGDLWEGRLLFQKGVLRDARQSQPVSGTVSRVSNEALQLSSGATPAVCVRGPRKCRPGSICKWGWERPSSGCGSAVEAMLSLGDPTPRWQLQPSSVS